MNAMQSIVLWYSSGFALGLLIGILAVWSTVKYVAEEDNEVVREFIREAA